MAIVSPAHQGWHSYQPSPSALGGEVRLLWSPLEPPLGIWEDSLQKWPTLEASLAVDTIPRQLSLGPTVRIST